LNKVNMSPSAFLEPETGALPATRLADALQAGGIFYHLPGLSKEEALRAVVDIIPLPADVERGFVFHMLLAREQLASTGVGDGIAIPHPRSPILLHVHAPLLSLCFLESAVDFGALDGKPVFALITIITANARLHLHLLSRLSFCRDLTAESLSAGRPARKSFSKSHALNRNGANPPEGHHDDAFYSIGRPPFGDRFGRAFFQERFVDRGRGLRHRGTPGIDPRGG
jgi:mannitol/fructose-specific phosphotransferase system IIA component (Ntr-type)